MLSLAACLAGCVPTTYQERRSSMGQAISPRDIWQKAGDLSDPPNAIDENLSTASISAEGYTSAAFTIDLGKQCLFNIVVLEHGNGHEFGYCRKVSVSTSRDGQRFIERAVAAGTRRVTTICMITPELARYVRIRAIEPGQRPWAIAEVHLR